MSMSKVVMIVIMMTVMEMMLTMLGMKATVMVMMMKEHTSYLSITNCGTPHLQKVH